MNVYHIAGVSMECEIVNPDCLVVAVGHLERMLANDAEAKIIENRHHV